jgi:hypothetical protein
LKKVISLVLVVVMMLGCIGFVACGGGDGGTTPPSNGETAPPSNGETTLPPTTGSVTWNDMPVYPGANQIEEMTWTIPSEDEEWSKAEWRYYETSASVSEVAAFYKSGMPGKGWQEPAWMDMVEMQWGYYSKNNEQDVAMVWISSEEGKTGFALMRATQ